MYFQKRAALARVFDHFVERCRVDSRRLFAQRRFARFRRTLYVFGVYVVGRGNEYRIDRLVGENGVGRFVGDIAVFFGQRSPRRIDVIRADHVDVFDFLETVGVVRAHAAVSDNDNVHNKRLLYMECMGKSV